MRADVIITDTVEIDRLDSPVEVIDYATLNFDEIEATERPAIVCNITGGGGF